MPTHVTGIPPLGHMNSSPQSDETPGRKDASCVVNPPLVHSPTKKEPFSETDKRINDGPFVVQGVDIVELQRLQTILAENPQNCQSLLVEEASQALEDSGGDDLVRGYETELEQIDQQLLELGPFAKDACVDREGLEQPVSAQFQPDLPSNGPMTPMTGRRTRRGRQPNSGQGRTPKRGSRNVEETESPNVRSDDEKSLVEEAVVDPEKLKEVPFPKKKWRKVGSGGRQQRRTRDRLLEQDSKANAPSANSSIPDLESLSSAPTSMNSPSIIPAASELEMLSLYFPSQRDSWASSPPDMQPSAASSTAGDSQGILSPRNLGFDAQSSSSLVSENTEEQQDENSVRGSKRSSATIKAPHVPTSTIAVPTPTLSTVSQPILNHMSDKTISERMDGLEGGQSLEQLKKRTPQSAVRGGLRPEHPVSGPKVQVYEAEPQITRLESIVSRSDSHISMPDPHPISTPPSVSKPPGFSIAHLTGGPEQQGSAYPFDSRSTLTSEQSSTCIQRGERGVSSPSIPGQYRDTDSPLLTSFKKRRSSSSSSHRSLKQHSFDDNTITKVTTQLPPPRAQSVSVISSAEWGASNVPYMLTQDGKAPGTPEPVGTTAAEKVAVVNPYTLWANTNQVPADSTPATNPLPQYPYPSPFLPANWLQARGGMLGSLPSFHPQVLLDPTNPYKPPMLAPYLHYRYPFPSAQGLKSPFPMASFNPATGATVNTQPRTPSASGSFAFSQTPLYPLPSNANISAFRNLNEASSQSTSGTPPIFQPSFGPIKEDKSGGENVHEKLPPLNWMQPSLLGPNFPAYFGTTPFTLGMQMPLTPNPVSQPPNVNPFAPRLGTSLSSPLTVTSQVESNLTKLERRPVMETTTLKMHQRTPSLGASATDVMSDASLKRSDVSPKPAVEMSRIPPSSQKGPQFPFGGDPQNKDQVKWKPIQDSPQLQNSSATPPLIVPPFATMFPTFPASSTVDARSHMITNTPPLPGHVTLAGGRMVPVGYATQPVVGRGRQDSSGGRGSPRSTPEKKKLRIHQVNKDDFKPQTKASDKRRRRPWRRNSKDKEDEKKDVKGGTPQLNHSRRDPDQQSSSPHGSANLTLPTTVAGLQAQTAATNSAPGDAYGLNMLAACSVQSRDQSEATPLTLSGEPQNTPLPTRTQMPSPVSLAGASTLLLLGKDVKKHHPTSETGAVAMATATKTSTPPVVTQVESTVVDSLLQLSSSVLTGMHPSEENQRSIPSKSGSLKRAEETENQLIMVQGRETRAASFSAAETMLMISQTPEEKKRGSDKQSGTLQDGLPIGHPAEEVEEVFEGRGKRLAVRRQGITKSQSESAGEVDSEETDTDSEATLSPTSPSWTGMELASLQMKMPTTSAEPEPAVVGSVGEPTRLEEDLAADSAEQLPSTLKDQDGPTEPKSPQLEGGIEESSGAGTPSLKQEERSNCSHEQQLTEATDMPAASDNPQPFLDSGGVADGADGQEKEVSEEEEKKLLDSPVPSPVSTKTQNEEASMVVMETNAGKTTSKTPDEDTVEMDAHHSDASPTQVQPEFESSLPLQPSSPQPSEVPESCSQELDPKSTVLVPESKIAELEPESKATESGPELEPELRLSESETAKPSQGSEEAMTTEAEELPLAKRPKFDDSTSPHNDLGESLVPNDTVPSPHSETPPETLEPQLPLHDTASLEVTASVEDTASVENEVKGNLEKMDGGEDEEEPGTLAESQDTDAVPLAEHNVLPRLQPQDSKEEVQSESTQECEKTVAQMEDMQPSTCSPCRDSDLQTSGAGSANVTDTDAIGFPLPAEGKDMTSPADVGDHSSSIDNSPPPVEEPPSPKKEQNTTLIGQRLPSWSHFAATASDTRVSPDPIISLSPEHRGSFDEELKAISPPMDCGIDKSSPSLTTGDDQVFSKDDSGANNVQKHSSCSPKHQRSEGVDTTRQDPSEHVSHSTNDATLESQQGTPTPTSAPIVPQNRLSVDKPGFGRYQRRRLSAQSLKHARDMKLESDERQAKKRPKPYHDRWLPGGLFDADPPPVKPTRRERVLEHEHDWPLGRKRERDDERHGFRKTKVMPSSKSSSHSYHGASTKTSAERTMLTNHPPHPRSYPPVDVPHKRHQRGGDLVSSQDQSRSHSREPSKPRSRPPSRQSRHASPVQSSHFHSPTWSNQREFSPLSADDESPAVRPRTHREPHKQWSPDDSNHHRERGYTHAKHSAQKRGHQVYDSHLGASKNHHASGFENLRKERRDGGGSRSASPERRKHHFGQLDQESRKGLEKSVSSVGRNRPLHEEGGRSGDLRRKSYESISEDELTFDLADQEPSSSREDQHGSEKKSSYEAGIEQQRSSWGSRMERKRRLSSGESVEEDDHGRGGGTKHQKHKHKKWQKMERKEVGKEHKMKRVSDDKHRHGHRKY